MWKRWKAAMLNATEIRAVLRMFRVHKRFAFVFGQVAGIVPATAPPWHFNSEWHIAVSAHRWHELKCGSGTKTRGVVTPRRELDTQLCKFWEVYVRTNLFRLVAALSVALFCLFAAACGNNVSGHTYAGNGEVVKIEFQSGGKAFASMGPATSQCTYTQDGKKVTLDLRRRYRRC